MITVNDILTQWQTFKAKVNQYYALIYNEVNVDATLDGLTSTSKTAEYNLWMWISAAISMIMDGLWTERKAEIQAIADAAIPGTDPWLQKQCFKFQYGDTLSIDDETGKYFYPTIDATKQIIKRCAIFSIGGVTTIKVAKLSGGNPVALSGPELTAFSNYIKQIQWAGSNIASPISTASDKIKAMMTVYYDGIVPLDTIKTATEAAYSGYFENLAFNGQYSVNKHGDYIENNAANVKEVVMGTVECKADGGSYAPVTTFYQPASGYIEADGSVDLDTLITYTAV